MTGKMRGFTLIELLVVIAIIGLLIGILLPALGSARNTAKKVVELSAARSLAQAFHLYADDHDGLVLPGYLTRQQVTDATPPITDEFGNEIFAPVSQRWAYRLGPYFDHVWAGTTHVNERASLLDEFSNVVRQSGIEGWSYQVTVLPSFGYNIRYIGGQYERTDWLSKGDHLRRMTDAIDPSGLLAFSSARYNVAGTTVGGYLHVFPPQLESTFNASDQTFSPALGFNFVDLRFERAAVVGWIDGHASTASENKLLDRRIWSNTARRLGAQNWTP